VIDASVWTVQYFVARRSRWLGIYDLLVPRGVLDELEDQRLRVSVSKGELKPYIRRSGWGYEQERKMDSVSEANEVRARPAESQSASPFDGPHADLRSAKSICGAKLDAIDGGMGRIGDVVVNPATWHVMALVANTRGRLPGKQVLVPVQWIGGIDLAAHVHTRLRRDVLRGAPKFDSRTTLNQQQIDKVRAYYSGAPHSS
jgi:hypothetical protein